MPHRGSICGARATSASTSHTNDGGGGSTSHHTGLDIVASTSRARLCRSKSQRWRFQPGQCLPRFVLALLQLCNRSVVAYITAYCLTPTCEPTPT